MALQQSKLLLFEAWSIWRKHAWQRVQQNYSLEIRAMKERIDSLKPDTSSEGLAPGFDSTLSQSGRRRAALHSAAQGMVMVQPEMQTFVIHSPQRYRSGEGLLNKLMEAQLFIQQAVAENTALRNFVHLLRAMHHWRLAIDAACRRKGMLRRVVRRWAAGALFKMFRQWAAVTSAAKRYAAVLRKVVARWSKGALWKALVMWKTAVADLVRLIIVAHRIIGKMQCRLLAGAFLRWSEQSSEQKRIMDGARKILGRWRKRMGGQAWLQWCFRVERRARLADIATRIILRWQMAQVYPYLEVDICMWSASFCLLRLPLYGVAFPPVSGLTL